MPKATLTTQGEQRFDLGPYGGRIKISGTLVGGADWKGGIEAILTVMQAGITVYEKTAKGFVRYTIIPPRQEIHTKKVSVSYEQEVAAGEPAVFKVALFKPTSGTKIVVEYEKNEPPPPPPPAEPGETGGIMARTAAATSSESSGGTSTAVKVGVGLGLLASVALAVRRWWL